MLAAVKTMFSIKSEVFEGGISETLFSDCKYLLQSIYERDVIMIMQ